jgi:hypothetical protein
VTREEIAAQLLVLLKQPSYKWTREQDQELAQAIAQGLWGDPLAKALQQIRPGVDFEHCKDRFLLLRQNRNLPKPVSSKPKKARGPRPPNAIDHKKEVLNFLFSRADTNGRVQVSQQEIANEIKGNRTSVQSALSKLIKEDLVAIIQRPVKQEPAVLLVKEAACPELGLGPISQVAKICPKKDAKRIAALAKEIGAIQLSVRNGVLIASLFGNAPAKSEFVGLYDEQVDVLHIEEDLEDLIKS